MNKTVVVTGATNGTGYAIARKFAVNGYDVAITSRDEGRAKEAAARLEKECAGRMAAFGFGLDVLVESQIVDMYEAIGAGGRDIDALVLNAANLGIGMANIFDVDYTEWMRVVETNIGWNFMFARNAARHMARKGKGAIVVVGSVNGIRTTKNRSAYCTSKTGLHGLARNLAVELGPLGIRTNVIVAGGIKTVRYHSRPEIRDSPHNRNPMGDIAEFEDIANAAFFLAGDEARLVDGAELAVDGGSLAQFVYEEEGIRLADGSSIC